MPKTIGRGRSPRKWPLRPGGLGLAKPQRDVPKAKLGMKSKKKYRLLGLAPTPGVYEGVGRGGPANGCTIPRSECHFLVAF